MKGSLRKLLRVTVYVLKFIAVLKARGSDGSASVGLSVKEISTAEEFWIKSMQGILHQDAKFQVWKTQFGLYCDNDIWQCKGRLTILDCEGQKYCVEAASQMCDLQEDRWKGLCIITTTPSTRI